MGAAPAKQNNFMMKVAATIVDRRNLIFLLIVIAIVFSVFSRNWVQVEDDLTAYLPADSATREGLDVMKDQFITYGSANFMVANISYEDAHALYETIKGLEVPEGASVSILGAGPAAFEQKDGALTVTLPEQLPPYAYVIKIA